MQQQEMFPEISVSQTQTLYPTMGDLKSVVDYGISQLPLTNANQVTTLLMAYHNTLLAVLHKKYNK